MVILNFNCAGKDWSEKFDNNFKAFQKQDQDAKDAGTLVGRYIQEQYADSYAYYVIVKENKKTVKIKSATGLGDDWQIPYWGDETTIDKEYAVSSIKHRDRIAELFAIKK